MSPASPVLHADSRALPMNAAEPRAVAYGRGVTAVTVALGLMLSLEINLLPAPAVMAIATFGLLGYLTAEILALRRTLGRGKPWMISPIVIASLYTLGLCFGLTNVLFWLPGYRETLPASRALDFYWLAQATLVACIGSAVMWGGFRSGLGQGLGSALWRSHFLARVIRPTYTVRWNIVWICVALSMAARLLLVSLGMYGVLGDAGVEGQTYRQFLNYAAGTGLVALMAIAVASFVEPGNARRRAALGLVLTHEILWGILAADKSDTITPLVVVGLVFYYVKRIIPWRYVALSAIVLVASYLVLMPLRSMGGLDVRNAKALIGAVASVATYQILSESGDENDTYNLGFAILQRLNRTRIASYAMRHKSRVPEDPVPKTFLETTLMTPVYTVIPRFVWPGKPRRQEVGRWFYVTVMAGKSETTLSGPTFVGYLYLAGGLATVLGGFFLVGILQRGIHERFLLAGGGGGLLILLGLMSALGDLPTQYATILAMPLRLFPILLVVQAILFRSAPPRYV